MPTWRGDDQVYAVDVPPELYRWTEACVIAKLRFREKKRKRKLLRLVRR